MLLYRFFFVFFFVFEGTFQVQGPVGFYSEGPIHEGAYFWNFTVRYYPVHRPANLLAYILLGHYNSGSYS